VGLGRAEGEVGVVVSGEWGVNRKVVRCLEQCSLFTLQVLQIITASSEHSN